MTLEEKANAYDEAIKRAKNVFNNCYHEETKTACSEIFPELNKSEDERTRKWIIEELKDSLNEINLLYSGDYDERDEEDVKRQSRLKEAIAYLEKLKEQKSSEWNEKDKKLLDFWLDVIDRNDWRMDENFCKASREFINKLKSFRPSWKPSKEQMYILNWVANILLSHDNIVEQEAAKKLQSLYNDLKEL